MSKKLGWAIVGCGVISTTHAKAIAAAPSAELIATCDIIPERAQKLASEYGAPHWYEDFNEMLKRDDIDVVSVCTPSGLHGVVAEAAARAKKHVFTEKPIEITRPAIDRMIQVCHDEGIKLGCVFQMRTYANNIAVRNAVQEGKLGKMVLADAYMKYYRSPEYYKSAGWRGTWELDGGGALMNQGVHGIDLLLWMAGDVESVVAQTDHLVRDIEVEDTAVAILKFKNGAFGVIEGTTSVTPGQGARFELHGNDGTVILRDGKIGAWHVPDVPQPGTGEEAEGGKAHSDPKAITATGHVFLVEDMCQAIFEDRDPHITGESARKAVDLILAIYESSRTNKRVYLD
jgi:UDP-N-acetyl-2-amino-2-deoxyglucuronate dehydrogenase